MKQMFSIFAILAILLFAACSHKSNPSKTIADNPKEKPVAIVEPPKVVKTTYQGTILPLLQAKCSPCHFPSKGGNKANYENFAIAQKNAAGMVFRIQLNPTDHGFMPARNPKLSPEEIEVFKKWVADGALEN